MFAHEVVFPKLRERFLETGGLLVKPGGLSARAIVGHTVADEALTQEYVLNQNRTNKNDEKERPRVGAS
jgi:hypothetical protein